jgi:hypothetical protein
MTFFKNSMKESELFDTVFHITPIILDLVKQIITLKEKLASKYSRKAFFPLIPHP